MRFSLAPLLAGCVALAGCSKPEPPKITPRSVQVVSMDAKSAKLKLGLDVANPNPFPLVVSSVSGTLKLGSGVELGSASATLTDTIPAKGSAPVDSELGVPWTNFGALAPLALSGAPVPYTFSGTAKVGGEKLNVSVPFELKGQLTQAQLIQAGLNGLPGLVPTQ